MTSAKSLSFVSANWNTPEVDKTNGAELVLELYDREQNPLKRYLAFLGSDPATAEDTVQECFLRLHQHLLAGGDRSNLRAWLYRVAHNLARNNQLAFRSSRTQPLEDWPGIADRESPGTSAETLLLAREEQARLRKAMARLSETQRCCLGLRAQGLKYREIAGTLELSVSTVAENVQRGLEKLKDAV